MAEIGDFISTIKGVFDKVVSGVNNATTTSLSQYTKDTQVFAHAYIDYNLVGDDICVPLLGTLNQMYVSFVITALNLDTFCASGRTVSDMIRKISSHEQLISNIDVVGVKGNVNVDSVIGSFANGRVVPKSEEQDVLRGVQMIECPSMEAGPIDLERESQRLITGRLIELDINSPVVTEDNTLGSYGSQRKQFTTFKLYIYVQIIPNVIPAEVCKGFLTANFVPTLAHRWKQVKAHEIKFWKDFVFASDLIKRQSDALKSDKTGILLNMIKNKNGKLISQIWDMFTKGDPSRNLANSFLIMSRDNFRQACAESNIDFTDYRQRQKFFLMTYCMMVVVVDSMSGSVDIYINGFKLVGNYTYDMINKVGSKGKDNFNLKEIMTAMSGGSMPRF